MPFPLGGFANLVIQLSFTSALIIADTAKDFKQIPETN